MTNWICLRPWFMLEFYNYFDNEAYTFVSPCGDSWHSENFKKIKMPYVKDITDIKNVWNGEILQQWRQSILDGSYSFCDKNRCLLYRSKFNLAHRDLIFDDIRYNKTTLDHGPTMLGYSADRSCNLSCASCRNSPILRTNTCGFSSFLSCLKDKDVKRFNMNTSGETFFNHTTLEFLRKFKRDDYPNIEEIYLVTNGTRLNEEMWETLGDSKEVIKKISVSVDAGTEETYLKIRKFKFTRLKENLIFISSLKKRGIIKVFRLNFVVQYRNVHEINIFCLLAKELECNMIRIDKMNDWQHLSRQKLSDLQVDENSDEYKKQVFLLQEFIIQNPHIQVVTNLT